MSNTTVYSLEMMMEIWNDRHGEHIEIGPDRDGLDLIEIRAFTAENIIEARMTFSKDQANLVAQAILKLLANPA